MEMEHFICNFLTFSMNYFFCFFFKIWHIFHLECFFKQISHFNIWTTLQFVIASFWKYSHKKVSKIKKDKEDTPLLFLSALFIETNV